MKKFKIVFASSIFLVLTLLVSIPTKAEDGYVITYDESSIICLVKYSLVGKYTPGFKNFSGLIYFDPQNLAKSSVLIRIKTDSIKSKYPTLDRIARSKRLLDAKSFPDVVFQSRKIEKRSDGYYVTGELSLHGVTKNFTFPFKLEGPVKEGNKSYIVAHGKWQIERKKFNVVWDKHLDQGGIVVGDQITVDWKVRAYK